MARDRKRAKQRRAREERRSGQGRSGDASRSGQGRSGDASRSGQGRSGDASRRPASRQEGPLAVERRSTVDPPDPADEASADAELAKEAARGAPADEAAGPRPGDEDPDAKAEVYPDELTDGEAGGGVLSDLVDRDADLDEDEPAFPDPATTQAAGGTRPPRKGGGSRDAATALDRPRRREPARAAEGNRVVAFLRACWAELQRVQWPDRRAVGQATAVVLGFVVIAGSFLGLMDFVWQEVVTALLDL